VFGIVQARSVANELKNVGYHTAILGKWHLGLESPNTPNERGFDFFQGFLGHMMDSDITHRRHDQNYMRLNDQNIEPEGHATDLFTQRTVDYLKERAANSDQPFFLYLALNAPHFPIEPPAEWLDQVRLREPTWCGFSSALPSSCLPPSRRRRFLTAKEKYHLPFPEPVSIQSVADLKFSTMCSRGPADAIAVSRNEPVAGTARCLA
jgi:arylsulfatase A-like enzyme